ncbi:MAG: OpgC domain-containing protein [Pseudomonadota bacterium]
MTQPTVSSRTTRDPRLDFFRGLAMFIILAAHTPGNVWTLWIPARFGFSDAADIFVFCSGLASAMAFGSIFLNKSWLLGTSRIGFRVWQVYWAHIGIFLVTAMLAFAIDHYDIGNSDRPYTHTPYVVPFFEQTGEAMLGLLTLTYVPGLFDILPMYLVILAMIPLLMLVYRSAGFPGVVLAMGALWLCANIAGYAHQMGAEDRIGLSAAHLALLQLGDALSFLNLPNNPFGEGRWFFNPFGWQIIFFTGFAFGMKWLPAPPINRTLIWVAALYVLAVIPFAWFKIHGGLYMPDSWALQDWIADTRAAFRFLWWKSDMGLARYVHFLAVAYLAFCAVGAGGRRLVTGFRAPRPLGPVGLTLAVIVLIVTIPYTYVNEIMAYLPALNDLIVYYFATVGPQYFGTDLFAPAERIGLLQIAHLIAAVVLIWAAIGQSRREWLLRDGFLATVPVIRKVGTQSLAVFMTSIPLARFNGWILDLIGRDVWTFWVVNCWGFAVLIAVAYSVSWFKSQPWRNKPKAAAPPSAPQAVTPVAA